VGWPPEVKFLEGEVVREDEGEGRRVDRCSTNTNDGRRKGVVVVVWTLASVLAPQQAVTVLERGNVTR
jgi:hypothetical protein